MDSRIDSMAVLKNQHNKISLFALLPSIIRSSNRSD